MSTTSKPSLFQLVQNVIDDVLAVARGHVELARAELRKSLRGALLAIAALTIALAMVNLGVILAFIAAVYAIADNGYPMWESFLIVSGSLVVLSFLVTLLAVAKLRKAARPSLTAEAINKTRAAFVDDRRTTS